MFSDAQLIERIRAGRRDDYGELVRRYQDGLYRHACGMGLGHDTSLDLVQDTFVKAYTRLDECRDPAHFRAWVTRIARNLCLDHLKNVRRSSIPFSALPDADQIADTSPHNPELNATLQPALDTLPVALREAFLLKHDADYTYEEVAELTNASVSAVKMRVHRAREQLRAFMLRQDIHAA